MADAAHELRTPLATLRITIEVVRSDADATLAEYQQLFAAVERALTRLEQLVAALLVLATEQQAILLEETLLVPLVEDVFATLELTAASHNVTLHLDTHTTASLCADAQLLSLVLQNLIENAIRYNHQGGCVTVNIDDTPEEIAVRVIDTGMGISEKEQAHIFERFYRVDQSRSRHIGGAGLGLSIVQHILHLHGGSVILENSSSGGSIFLVRLPKHLPRILLQTTAYPT